MSDEVYWCKGLIGSLVCGCHWLGKLKKGATGKHSSTPTQQGQSGGLGMAVRYPSPEGSIVMVLPNHTI